MSRCVVHSDAAVSAGSSELWPAYTVFDRINGAVYKGNLMGGKGNGPAAIYLSTAVLVFVPSGERKLGEYRR